MPNRFVREFSCSFANIFQQIFTQVRLRLSVSRACRIGFLFPGDDLGSLIRSRRPLSDIPMTTATSSSPWPGMWPIGHTIFVPRMVWFFFLSLSLSTSEGKATHQSEPARERGRVGKKLKKKRRETIHQYVATRPHVRTSKASPAGLATCFCNPPFLRGSDPMTATKSIPHLIIITRKIDSTPPPPPATRVEMYFFLFLFFVVVAVIFFSPARRPVFSGAADGRHEPAADPHPKIRIRIRKPGFLRVFAAAVPSRAESLVSKSLTRPDFRSGPTDWPVPRNANKTIDRSPSQTQPPPPLPPTWR